jgi:hypothetical protein
MTTSPTPALLTPASLDLFLRLFKDAGNWGGHPYTGGNIGLTHAERGNLTDLKIRGLLKTHDDPKKHGGGGPYVSFTEAGIALAKTHGLEVCW